MSAVNVYYRRVLTSSDQRLTTDTRQESASVVVLQQTSFTGRVYGKVMNIWLFLHSACTKNGAAQGPCEADVGVRAGVAACIRGTAATSVWTLAPRSDSRHSHLHLEVFN